MVAHRHPRGAEIPEDVMMTLAKLFIKMSLTIRNEKILNSYRNGTPAKILAREYNLSHRYINRLAYEARVNYASDSSIKIGEIVTNASRIFKVAEREIYSNAKNDRVVTVRFCVYLAARKNNFSYIAIGRKLKKDHSTIISGVRNASKRLTNDEEFAKMFEQLTEVLNETQTRTCCAGSD